MKATTKQGGSRTGKEASKPGAAIRDGSGEWAAGLRHDAQAALVGTILAGMPHLDELMADLIADHLGSGTRAVLAALDDDDGARVELLRALPGMDVAFAATIADYAAARRAWRAYGRGLWYTHESGRTYLAAPDSDGTATFRVAREVKPGDLRRALDRIDTLADSLIGLMRTPPALRAPPQAPASRPAKAPPASGSAEAGRAGRSAPPRTAGAKRRRAPVQPPRAAAAPPEAGGTTPVAAE